MDEIHGRGKAPERAPQWHMYRLELTKVKAIDAWPERYGNFGEPTYDRARMGQVLQSDRLRLLRNRRGEELLTFELGAVDELEQ